MCCGIHYDLVFALNIHGGVIGSKRKYDDSVESVGLKVRYCFAFYVLSGYAG